MIRLPLFKHKKGLCYMVSNRNLYQMYIISAIISIIFMYKNIVKGC